MLKCLFGRCDDSAKVAEKKEPSIASAEPLGPLGANIGPGDRVVDSISGLTGVVVCMSFWLNGCIRVTISPETTDNGKLVDNHTLDLNQLQLVRKRIFNPGFEVIAKLKNQKSELQNYTAPTLPGGDRENPTLRKDPV